MDEDTGVRGRTRRFLADMDARTNGYRRIAGHARALRRQGLRCIGPMRQSAG
jgi:hypothetical protein